MTDSTHTRTIISIDPHQLGKILGLLYAAVGVLIGVFVVIGSFVSPETRTMLIFGILAPVIYGLIGYLSGLIGGTLYNWAAGRLGGIRITVVAEES